MKTRIVLLSFFLMSFALIVSCSKDEVATEEFNTVNLQSVDEPIDKILPTGDCALVPHNPQGYTDWWDGFNKAESDLNNSSADSCAAFSLLRNVRISTARSECWRLGYLAKMNHGLAHGENNCAIGIDPGDEDDENPPADGGYQ